MDPAQAVILGIVQGLTEFFPVSSSGHLVIFQHLFGLREPALLFDICVHVGTLIAVLLYFQAEIGKLLGAVGRYALRLPGKGIRQAAPPDDPHLKMAALILAGSVPTAVLGYGFHQIAGRLFSSLFVVSLALFFTSALLLATRFFRSEGTGILGCTLRGAALVGLFQGLAVIPGVSRSGATIAACLMLGLDRDTAARFSFLLAIPAILGALLLSLASGPAGWGAFSAASALLGTAVSAGVGYAALAGLIRIVRNGRLFYFAPYCFLLGSLLLAAALRA
jgi:undecaprenyl-diphosphatase